MSKHKSKPFLPLHTTQILVLLMKLIVVFAALFFIYYKLTSNNTLDVKQFLKYLDDYNIITLKNVFILICLSGINWLLESFKWQVLVHNIAPLSVTTAIEQSLGSLTASLITPNRIGEYGAKAIYYPKPLRKKILGLTLIGNLAQLSVTLILGCVGLSYVVCQFNLAISFTNILLGALVLGTMILIYHWFFSKNKFEIKGYSFQKLKTFTSDLNQYTVYKTIGISTVRYICFSHQFYVLLWLFNVNVSYLDAIALITSMYIIASIIPTVFIFDVVIKGSVAVWLFSLVNANEFIIVTCATLMWLLNFALPSIIGSYFVLNFKLPTKE